MGDESGAMLARAYPMALIWVFLFLWSAPLMAQEQELIRSQAGRYPLRAYLTKPAAVGPARVVVELGPPQTSINPRTRKISIGSPPDSPYASPTPVASSALQASDFNGVKVTAALDMPDMPATKPVTVELKSTTIPGRYEGDALLTMQGTWQVLFLIAAPDGSARKSVTFQVGGESRASKGTAPREGLELCSPDSAENVPVTVHCLPDPPRVGSNRLRIEMPDAATIPMMIGVAMPGMTFGLPPTEALRQDDGSYEAVINLPMAGYWQLRVDLNGRALPPFALNVKAPTSAGPSPNIIALLLVLGMVPLIVWCALKRRKLLLPVILCGLPLLVALGIGAWVENRAASDHAAGMTMEMMAADMGLGHMTAPLPVLEAKVATAPFVVSRGYQGTVIPSNETIVLSPRSGVLAEVATSGSAVEKAEVVARVGQEIVKAPFRGVAVRVLSASAAQVSAGEPLLVLTDTRRVGVLARAPVADRASIKVGMNVQIADIDGVATRGKVTRVAALSQTGTFEFEAVVDARKVQGALLRHDGSVLAPAGERDVFFVGQNATVQVELERLPDSASVPTSAIRQSADGSRFVFVVERVAGHRVVHKQPVTLGVDNGVKVQVLSGLEPGQHVVASQESSLRDGDVVVPATVGEGVFRSLYVPGNESH